MSSRQIICFTHPQYTGQESPTLTCKTCCGIFVGVMKVKIAAKESNQNPSQDSINKSVLVGPLEGREIELSQNSLDLMTYNPGSI